MNRSTHDIRRDFLVLNYLVLVGGAAFYYVGVTLGRVDLAPLEILGLLLFVLIGVGVIVATEVYALLHRVFGKFWRYVAVGFANTGLDFALLNWLIYLTDIRSGWPVALMNLASFLLATTHSFPWMRSWVYQASGRPTWREFGNFWLVTAVGGVVSSIIMWLGTALLASFAHGYVSVAGVNAVKTFAIMVWVGLNFYGYGKRTFKSNR